MLDVKCEWVIEMRKKTRSQIETRGAVFVSHCVMMMRMTMMVNFGGGAQKWHSYWTSTQLPPSIKRQHSTVQYGTVHVAGYALLYCTCTTHCWTVHVIRTAGLYM